MVEITAPPGSPGPETASPALIAGLSGVPASMKAVLLACLNIRGGQFLLTLPNERTLRFGEKSGPAAAIKVSNYRFARRLLTHGDIGFAESYIEGEWETPDLPATLILLADNAERISRVFFGNPIGRFLNTLRHWRRENTKAGSKKNIHAHYDLGNQFYGAWLDRTMTYSSARFDTQARDLEAGQLAKYRALAEHLELRPGDHVLEIGCGWGGFAEVAAGEFGARVTGLTISDEQLAFARARMEKAGLTHLVEIRHQDYRDVQGPFDKVASIEMFEAVGEKYWPVYFNKIAEVLKPGGKAALQIITIRDDLFEGYRRRADFIQRFIFPGGMLASITRLKQEVSHAGLAWGKLDAFGESYADTLATWRERFQEKWEQVRSLGFDEKFKQLWRFYLSYCEAGFRTGRTDVVQISLAKT